MPELPIPRMTATLIPPPEGADIRAVGNFRIDLDLDADRRPTRPATVPGERRKAIVASERRPCHCTTCGGAGHNSRSKKCPDREVEP